MVSELKDGMKYETCPLVVTGVFSRKAERFVFLSGIVQLIIDFLILVSVFFSLSERSQQQEGVLLSDSC